MIECVKENIYYRKRKLRFKKKRFFSIFIVLLVVVCCVLYYKFFIYNQLVSIMTDFAYSYSTESVNKAVLNSLDGKVSYSELIHIEKNQSGDIVMMTTDSYKVNYVNREIANSTAEILNERLEKGVSVPLLAFTGIGIFSGYGTPVILKNINVSSVVCNFNSQFTSVGINQTLHSIYVDVLSTVFIEMPLEKKIINTKTSVLISETILVGKVPDLYLNGNLFK